MIVVKVGGSLFDWPDLGPRLREFLATLGDDTLIVPGGGAIANAIRQLDATHGLGEEVAHWLALRAMSLNAHVLAELLDAESKVVDPFDYVQADESNEDHLPHSWSVTSDAVAARLAVSAKASELILLKSAAPPAGDLVAWAAADYVDEWLPKLLADNAVAVRAIDFRREHS